MSKPDSPILEEQSPSAPRLPRLEEEVNAAVTGRGGTANFEEWRAEYDRRLSQLHERLHSHARATSRAMDGWDNVRTPEEWQNIVEQASEQLDNASFLIERLGAERYLDPPLMAVLMGLRRRLIEEHGLQTAAELMIVDSAVLSFYHQIRINGWIGDLSTWLEREFFRKEPMMAKLPNQPDAKASHVLQGEVIVRRICEQLMPLFDRANRMLLRNLKALRDLRQEPAPNVSIGSAGQVNVAAQQVNESVAGE
jgi:hypothetical protein